jgi:hypothetical protein
MLGTHNKSEIIPGELRDSGVQNKDQQTHMG